MSVVKQRNLLEGVSVLLLDDEQTIRQVVSKMLQRQAAEVTTASDGWEGLQRLFDRGADVLIVDIRMPKMDGITFLQEALAIWPWLGVVVITGYDAGPLRPKLETMGVSCILEKPFSSAELISALQEELRRAREASVQEQRIPLRRIQQQLQLLKVLTEPAMKAETLLQALRHLSVALAQTMEFAVVGVCGHELDQTVTIFNVKEPVTQNFVEELKDYLLDRYYTFSGEDLDGRLRVELTGRDLVDYGAQALGTTFCVPIMSGGDMQGFLILAAAKGVDYDAAEISFIYTIANHLSTIFTTMHQMRSLAIRDPLTGLYNRLHLEAEAERIWSWGQRNELPIAIMVVDIDHFKAINDTYGHYVGDQVLREFAQLLEDNGRASDIVGRYGGEEFMVILPESDQTAGFVYANRLLKKVRQHVFYKGEYDLHMTVSLGMSIGVGQSLQNKTMQTVLDEADRAMYEAKHAGRNCIRCWTQVEQPASSAQPVAGEVGEPRPDQRKQRGPISKGNLLVVDDDANIRRILREMLLMESYQVKEAADGLAAMSEIEQNPGSFDVVLTDIQMPGLNGLDLINRIKAFDDTIICVIISGNASAENAIESLRQGAYDFIEKPFPSFGQVTAIVRRAVEYRKAILENRQYQSHLSAMIREKSAKARQAVEEVADSYSFTLEALVGLLDARERGTGVHSKRVRDLALRLGQEFELSEDELSTLSYGALLHDIGKIGVPDHILLKPGSLTSEERKIMRGHVEIGYQILSGSSYLEAAADIVISHHERYDGSGYPQGLAGNQIPLGGRIFAIVDAYDAMRTDRIYRSGMAEDVVVDEIVSSRGCHFDPAVVDMFLRCREALDKVYQDWENRRDPSMAAAEVAADQVRT